MNLRLERVSKIRHCRCQNDNLFSSQDPHWESSVFKLPARRFKMTHAPWPMPTGPCSHKTENDRSPTPASDSDSLLANISESSDHKQDDDSETNAPKKINIDSKKLMSSVFTKTQRAHTVCNTRPSCTRRASNQIKKSQQFPTHHLDYSYSRRLSASCCAKAIQGLPNMLSRFNLSDYTFKGTNSALILDQSTKSPKVTFYQPKFV